MKGTDWGKLVARATAIYLVFSSVLMLLRDWQLRDQFSGSVLGVQLVSTIALGVLVWVLADKIMPREKQEEEADEREKETVAAILVASIASLTFLSAVRSLADSFLIRSTLYGEPNQPSIMTVWFQIVICGILLAVVANASS